MTYVFVLTMSMLVSGTEPSKITVETPMKDKAACEIVLQNFKTTFATQTGIPSLPTMECKKKP